ncbi:MAG TPA: PQQ-binding-like beta-propeller repeat protein [Candidatus Dormibacteraeota bacterium]|nr:PQQ-binding-like beta-propeller repeat protein [Candidatus Dormibacteraeota bacterium]
MPNAARYLVAIASTAVMLAVGVAIAGTLLFRATVRDTATSLYPSSRAPAAWTTTWQRDAPAAFRSALVTRDGPAPPQLVGDTVYALGSDRRVHAIDARTGVPQWQFGYEDRRRIFNFRATPGPLVLLVRGTDPASGLASSEVVGMEPGASLPAWDTPLNADVFTASFGTDGTYAYVAVADNVDGGQYRTLHPAASLHPRVRAYGVADGVLRWEQPLPERTDTPPVDAVALTVADRQVVATQSAAGSAVSVVALDAAHGQVLWPPLFGAQVLGTSQGELVVGTGSDLSLVNPATGRAYSRLPSLAPAGSDATSVDGTVLYWTGSDQVTAVDLAGGRRLWSTPLDRPTVELRSDQWAMRPPAVQGGVLYLGGGDQQTYAIDVRTGTVEWKFPAARAPDGPNYPPLRVGSLVLVQDDQLIAYEAPS